MPSFFAIVLGMKNPKLTDKPPTISQTLSKLLTEQEFSSQDEIVVCLKKQGFVVNQTKVSRLLHKIGAIKVLSQSGDAIYRLPEISPPVSPDKALAKLVISIKHNENLIIIRTTPGSASLIGSLLDNQQLNLLGTIAGDDTLFIAPQSVKQITAIVDKISALLSFPS